MTILVSLPTYQTPPEMLDRAIFSILSQTFPDLCLVVIGDGEQPEIDPFWVGDSRLTVFTLPENRGRYFADAVAQQANPFDWWSPHDGDDWSSPDRFDDLWDRRETGAVWSAVETDGNIHTMPNAMRKLRPRLHGTGYHIGLYSADRIRATGGYHPGYRVAYDTLFNILVRMTGEVALSPRPLYHRHKWPGSLTLHRHSGRGSRLRNQSVASLDRLHTSVWLAYTTGHVDQLAAVVTQDIEPELREQVGEQAELLRKMLD